MRLNMLLQIAQNLIHKMKIVLTGSKTATRTETLEKWLHSTNKPLDVDDVPYIDSLEDDYNMVWDDEHDTVGFSNLPDDIHINYPSIERVSSLSEEDIDKFASLNLLWNVTEKIHGANFSIITDGLKCVFNKRTAAIDFEGGEKFCGLVKGHPLLATLKHKALKTYQAYVDEGVLKYSEKLTIFGELCGGAYGKNVIPGVSRIQKGVDYSPEIKFIAFETFPHGAKEPYNNVLADSFELAPYFESGDFRYVLSYIETPRRTCACDDCLVQLEDNIAEGYVITAWDYKHNTLFRFKHHNEGFKEKKAETTKVKSKKEPVKLSTLVLKELDLAITQHTYLLKSIHAKDPITKEQIPFVLKGAVIAVHDMCACTVLLMSKEEISLVNKIINKNIMNYLTEVLSI